MTDPRMKVSYLLFAAIAGGAAYATFGPSPSSAAPQSIAAPVEAAAQPAAMPSAFDHESPSAEESPAGSTIEGEVLEVLDVTQYTYARVGARGTAGSWIAVPSTKLALGAHVAVRDGMRMEQFQSTALKRTFPEIWFGTLSDDGTTAGGAGPHGGADSVGVRAGVAAPHGGVVPAAPLSDDKIGRVARASGPNAKTVAEAITERTSLAGKTVRIRAVVVKSTGGVLGHTYLHVRDGSGDQKSGTNDLSVTCAETPAVGDTVEVEGTLALDRDIGSGYKFPTILEDAKILTP